LIWFIVFLDNEDIDGREQELPSTSGDKSEYDFLDDIYHHKDVYRLNVSFVI